MFSAMHTISASAKIAFAESEMVVKVKEPLAPERALMGDGLVGYLPILHVDSGR